MTHHYIDIIEKIPIEKGWSADKKYRAITASGESYLLRITPPERINRLELQCYWMAQAAKLDIPMSMPLEDGVCAEGPYLIQSWIDGMDAEEALPGYSQEQQYAYGLEAGRILRKIHSIPAPAEVVKPWDEYFGRKIDRKLTAYAECELKYDKDQPILDYTRVNRNLLELKAPCLRFWRRH